MNQNLEAKIESTRKELIIVAGQKGISSTETLKISQLLDSLINEYNSRERMPEYMEWLDEKRGRGFYGNN
ncbi:aspartyl-phosphate phosphatase Spo0E family protein [Sporosarcina sp. SAFN-015]|uniref:aspartyl-phosphate phosphatase Spo0E family protein n=1 Tax=Sporosarcina sp. SAFN-015 TaxID=3387274 RepID=UPI003F7F5F7B